MITTYFPIMGHCNLHLTTLSERALACLYACVRACVWVCGCMGVWAIVKVNMCIASTASMTCFLKEGQGHSFIVICFISHVNVAWVCACKRAYLYVCGLYMSVRM